MPNLEESRSKIDEIDTKIIELFEERMKATSAGKPQDFSIYNMRAYIYNYPNKRLKNKYYADLVNMSISHFQRTYEKTFGVTPTQDIILSRVERVKYLLKNNKFKCFLKKAFSGRMAIVSSIGALLLVGATLALLFSKGNTVTNTFNPGKVDVKVNESINGIGNIM